VELSLDTASEMASIAISEDGVVLAERTWRCERNHTVELLPAVEKLLTESGTAKEDITAVFVCIGPGMYTGLRVGVTTAKGLAHSLEVPIVGVERLELDAHSHADFSGEIVAVHRAGRGDYAWASYRANPWREVTPPTLSKAEGLAAAVQSGSLLVGEVDDALASKFAAGVTVRTDEIGRASALADLGFRRLAAGRVDEAALLVPIYLRPPAIGPRTVAE
jgi:tRNA threonylcarbamoyl adenosine modification protein YeaZ